MKQKKIILLIFLLNIIVGIYAIDSDAKVLNKEFKVVGINTVLGTVENPDVFFEDTYFEELKPTKILNGKSEYDRRIEQKNATGYKNINDHNPENPISRVKIYKVKKAKSAYTFWFSCDAEERGKEKEYKGKTTFSNKKELEKYANNIAKKKSLAASKTLIKIYDVFTKNELRNLSIDVIQETEDFLEAIALIDDCYICLILRKI
ncbi:MAG: hypothetical protein CR988_06020 [Treponema sp.]|nr:MAG: hypothetical protein CR988_06020 [Treponema sp.]